VREELESVCACVRARARGMCGVGGWCLRLGCVGDARPARASRDAQGAPTPTWGLVLATMPSVMLNFLPPRLKAWDDDSCGLCEKPLLCSSPCTLCMNSW